MQDLENLKTAALQAGKIALGYFNKNYRTWDKEAGAGPVTEADLKANEIIVEQLFKLDKSIPCLSEESNENSNVFNEEIFWAVDPLDGTKDFIQGTGNYAMHLALNYKGKPYLGIVLIPSKNEL